MHIIADLISGAAIAIIFWLAAKILTNQFSLIPAALPNLIRFVLSRHLVLTSFSADQSATSTSLISVTIKHSFVS